MLVHHDRVDLLMLARGQTCRVRDVSSMSAIHPIAAAAHRGRQDLVSRAIDQLRRPDGIDPGPARLPPDERPEQHRPRDDRDGDQQDLVLDEFHGSCRLRLRLAAEHLPHHADQLERALVSDTVEDAVRLPAGP